jgi:putative tryptophan/tyrosine transport system substrate-binding protein
MMWSFRNRKLAGEFNLGHHLPLICAVREFAYAGGLISYGADFLGTVRRLADLINRIARGDKPSDLPVKQPTKFELIVNLKNAKALGVTVPPVPPCPRRRFWDMP